MTTSVVDRLAQQFTWCRNLWGAGFDPQLGQVVSGVTSALVTFLFVFLRLGSEHRIWYCLILFYYYSYIITLYYYYICLHMCICLLLLFIKKFKLVKASIPYGAASFSDGGNCTGSWIPNNDIALHESPSNTFVTRTVFWEMKRLKIRKVKLEIEFKMKISQ